MIDKLEMHLLLQTMERAAEDALQSDPAFFESLYALKSEIERNPRVQTALRGMQSFANRILTSFVPRINVRVRGDNGVLGLTHSSLIMNADPQFQRLTEELRTAAAEVIGSSSHHTELKLIVNEAISSSDVFEGIASRIEQEGYEIMICLDFSACTRVPSGIRSSRGFHRTRWGSEPSSALSMTDRRFLSSIGIRPDF
jgi:hypothetical protein